MWASMVLAYERLPDRIKERIDGLYAKHTMEQYFGSQLPREKRLKLAERMPTVEHPVVVKHPETGEKLLYVNQPFTTHFSNYMNFDEMRYGQDFFEGGKLLDYLKSQPQHPEFQVRLKWRPGTVAMWDNLLDPTLCRRRLRPRAAQDAARDAQGREAVMKIDGACLCGQFRYEAEINPGNIVVCHCTDCQVSSATAFRVGVMVPADKFKVVAGALKVYVKTAESGKKRALSFCPECGTSIHGSDPVTPKTSR